MVALDYELKQTWHRLNYVVEHTRELMPKTEDAIHSLQEALRKIKVKIDNAQQEFEKEHDLLTKKISACDVRLGDIRRKRKHYDESFKGTPVLYVSASLLSLAFLGFKGLIK